MEDDMDMVVPRWACAGLRQVVALLCAVALFGCGNKKGDASVEACEAWLATMECGETDHRDEFNCQIYADQRCDVSDYFGCLAAKTECDEETSEFDFSGWDDCAVVAGCAD
jgi:hypothetical protein